MLHLIIILFFSPPTYGLLKFAEEIEKRFQIKSTIFWTPSFYENGKSTPPVGKFVNKINYGRKVLKECGLFVSFQSSSESTAAVVIGIMKYFIFFLTVLKSLNLFTLIFMN